MVETTNCRGCGRKVIFAVDENGTRQILDAVSPCYVIDEHVPHESQPPTQNAARCVRSRTAYVSHFITCPERAQFSKGGK